MQIHVHSVMRNEERILPFWLRHYLYIADCICIYDDHSDDETRNIAQDYGAIVEDYPGEMLDDGEMANFYSGICAGASKFAWIICVDADEMLWMPLTDLDSRKEDVIEVMGYEMKSPIFPQQDNDGNGITEMIKTGIPAGWWHNDGYKPCIVRGGTPVLFECGRHNLKSRQPFKIWRTDEIKLLHYRDMGYEYYKWHHERNAARLSPNRKDKTWGQHNYKPMSKEAFALSLLDSEWII